MKRLLLALHLSLGAVAAHAATLSASLPAYASPNEQAPVLGTAVAGSRIVITPAPSGWQAVELAGPHTVYVAEKDTLKNFEVRPGAAYLSAPRADAPVVGLAGDKDPAAFADVAGRYNKFSLNKPIVAYVRAQPTPVAPVVSTPPPAPVVAAAPATVTPASPAPIAPAAPSYEATLRNDIPATSPVSPGRGLELGEPRLARTFFGTLASSRSAFRPRRPHDFQLNDSAGQRIAYIDVSRLMQTEQIDAFIGRPVTIFGTAQVVGPSSDVVIQAETLKLQ
jgi:hypothetical protein